MTSDSAYQLSLLRNSETADMESRVKYIQLGSELVRVSPVFQTYWQFAAERQKVFFRKLKDENPLTADPILRTFKFTNAYRASDRVSQFLIRSVIYAGDQSPKEVFFRTLLFKLFNKIETWKLLTAEIGQISFRTFSIELYDRILCRALAEGKRIYSAAYIMPSGGRSGVGKKHNVNLAVLQRMMNDDVPAKLTECRSMNDGFQLLRSYPLIGNFLAYQFVTDLNYSRIVDFSEMEFVKAGPGALDGIRKCFPDLDIDRAGDVIRFMADHQMDYFNLYELNFQDLWGRPLQLIDCQNLFCEVDKYARKVHPSISGVSGRTRIKQQFSPRAEPLRLFYPPKWGINQNIPPEHS